MITDAHAHLITDDRVNYPPAPDGNGSEEDFANAMTAERLLREMDHNGVERAILVHRASVYGFDNSYVCDSAAANPARLTAVCSIKADDPDVSSRVRYWVEERKAAGIRFMEPQRGADLSWLGCTDGRAAWRTADELGVPVCVHFFRWNREAGLAALADLVRQFPRVKVVIDHLSNMASESGPPDFGLDSHILRFAGTGNVVLKYTTIPLGGLEARGMATAPVLARVVAEFGADRVMWGSDITQSKGTYDHMVDLARRSTEALSDRDREQVLSGTASAVYAWRA